MSIVTEKDQGVLLVTLEHNLGVLQAPGVEGNFPPAPWTRELGVQGDPFGWTSTRNLSHSIFELIVVSAFDNTAAMGLRRVRCEGAG